MRKIPQSIPRLVQFELFRPLTTGRRSRQAALRTGVVLVFFCAMLYAAAPARLPLLIQRLVGLTSALLVMLFVTFSLNELGASFRKFGMSDVAFSRLLTLIGWLVFALVLTGWFTRLAPIQGY
jgi:hypothetical protein